MLLQASFAVVSPWRLPGRRRKLAERPVVKGLRCRLLEADTVHLSRAWDTVRSWTPLEIRGGWSYVFRSMRNFRDGA